MNKNCLIIKLIARKYFWPSFHFISARDQRCWRKMSNFYTVKQEKMESPASILLRRIFMFESGETGQLVFRCIGCLQWDSQAVENILKRKDCLIFGVDGFLWPVISQKKCGLFGSFQWRQTVLIVERDGYHSRQFVKFFLAIQKQTNRQSQKNLEISDGTRKC